MQDPEQKMADTDVKRIEDVEGLRARIRQWQDLYDERDAIGYDPKRHTAQSPEHRRYTRITWDIHRVEEMLFANWDTVGSSK